MNKIKNGQQTDSCTFAFHIITFSKNAKAVFLIHYNCFTVVDKVVERLEYFW